MSTMVYFDTLRFVETLKDSGMPEKQAKALAKVQQESLSECLDTSIATKADVLAVKTELKAEIQEVKTELKTTILEIKHELKADIKLLRWMIGVMSTGILTLILKAFFNV